MKIVFIYNSIIIIELLLYLIWKIEKCIFLLNENERENKIMKNYSIAHDYHIENNNLNFD